MNKYRIHTVHTKEAYMKKKLLSKKNFYLEITAVLILVITFALIRYTSIVQKTATNQCFSILDDSRTLLGQMITNEMQTEQEHLEAASALLENLLPDYDNNEEMILQIMNASSADKTYSHWEICLPDERVFYSDGTQLELGPKYSFQERVQEGFSVSERRTALKDGKSQIIMLSKCIFHNRDCVGILSSVIDLNSFSRLFQAKAYNEESEIMLFERGTGDILIDSWHHNLGNISDSNGITALDGYDWNEVAANYDAGNSGHAAFLSEEKGETMYLSYAPTGYSDWEILVFAPDSVCMETANTSKTLTYQTIFFISLAFFIFLSLIIIGEKHRAHLQAEREIQLKDALEKANRANAAKSDFLSRMSDTEVNKRNVENFIKAGAFDSLEGTRKQFMSVFVQLMDQNQQNRKNNMAGQLSLFDLVDESEKKNYEIRFPDVGEYPKEILLTFEKEVLGVYVSGHPLQEYEQLWRRNISNTTADFMLDEETNSVHIQDGAKAVIGGIIEEKKIKYTKNDKVMAFLQVEDLVGTIEVIVFPKTYEQYGSKLMEDEKVLLRGRVSAEEDKDAKLICESVQTFDEIPKKLWIKFPTMEAYQQQEKKLLSAIAASDGKDTVVIYVENPRAMKQLGANQTVHGDEALLKQLEELFGEENVKLM